MKFVCNNHTINVTGPWRLQSGHPGGGEEDLVCFRPAGLAGDNLKMVNWCWWCWRCRRTGSWWPGWRSRRGRPWSTWGSSSRLLAATTGMLWRPPCCSRTSRTSPPWTLSTRSSSGRFPQRGQPFRWRSLTAGKILNRLQVGVLPKGASVEVEAVAMVGNVSIIRHCGQCHYLFVNVHFDIKSQVHCLPCQSFSFPHTSGIIIMISRTIQQTL